MDKKNKEIEKLKSDYENNKLSFLKEIEELKENKKELEEKNKNNEKLIKDNEILKSKENESKNKN